MGKVAARLERVEHAGRVLALIVRARPPMDGLEFYTGPDLAFQMGAQEHGPGFVVQPHVHRPAKRTIEGTSEFILVASGRVEVRLYDDARRHVGSKTLEAGDAVLLLAGGHALRFLERSRILEVKQGPYGGESSDKEKFADPALR